MREHINSHETPLQANSDSTSIAKKRVSSARSIKHLTEQYIFGDAEGLRKWCCERGPIFVVLSSFFRGVGQVCFMDNPWTVRFITLLHI